MTTMTANASFIDWNRRAPRGWLVSPRFDVGMLIGSALLVPIILVATWLGASDDLLNLSVTALVGGPHLASTYSTLAGDRTHRHRMRWAFRAALLIPPMVIFLAISRFPLLINVFMAAASVHVLHQSAHITDRYRASTAGATRSPWAWDRIVDYGFVCLSLYPVALYRIQHGQMSLGDVRIVAPWVLMRTPMLYVTWAVFGFFACAWVVKTIREVRRGTLVAPKTALIAATVGCAIVVPLAATGERLGLAFQSLNAWHSVQYLGLVWLAARERRQAIALRSQEPGADRATLAERLSGARGAAWFYLGNLGITVALLVVIKGVARLDPFGLKDAQYYYMFVLSPLLMHYFLDSVSFATSTRKLFAASA
jgi:hypothetical protein